MKRSVLLIAATATAAAVLTACGGEEASDNGSTASTTVSKSVSASATTPVAPAPGPDAGTASPAPEATEPAPQAAEPAPGTAEPAPEATPPAPEPTPPADTGVTEPPASPDDPCSWVSDEYLTTSLQMTSPPGVQLVPLQESRCTGTMASANHWGEGALHPELYVFQYSEAHGHWRFVEHGYGGMDCAGKYGLSAEAAAILRC